MKKYKNLFIGLSLPISLTLLPIIVSCKDNKTKVENNVEQEISNKLEQEVTRINNLNLSLNTTLLFKDQINKDNLLTHINGLIKNDNFDYSIDQFANDENSIKFKIKITFNGHSKLSKQFSLIYNDLTPHLSNEQARLNSLTIPDQTFSQSEINSINENNILDIIGIEIDKESFDYEISNFKKNTIEKSISFNIKVTFKVNKFHPLETKKFNFNYQISDSNQTPDNNAPINPDGPSNVDPILKEKIRLESQTPILINSNITYQELLDINIENLLNKVTNLTLDTTNFKYVVNILEKNLNNSSKIRFNIVVANKNDEGFKYYENYVFFELNYNLIKEEKQEQRVSMQEKLSKKKEVVEQKKSAKQTKKSKGKQQEACLS